jgi:hypothetical protein
MTQHTGPGGHPISPVQPHPQQGLIRVSGAVGIAACIIGLLIFFAACFGFQAIFPLSILPLLMGAVGLVIAIVAGFMYKNLTVQDMGMLAALFINLMGLIGGVVLVAVWRGWTVLPGAAGM